MMTQTIEQVAAFSRVQVEEYAWDDNDFFFEAGLEEREAVGDGGWEGGY